MSEVGRTIHSTDSVHPVQVQAIGPLNKETEKQSTTDRHFTQLGESIVTLMKRFCRFKNMFSLFKQFQFV